VHRKSPLLVATPPQITRALAYSHPFILPLNRLLGLITWTSGDSYESFLLLASFWASVLYGDLALRWAGPPLLVLFIITGMYIRRYSPLSSTSGGKDAAKKIKEEESTSGPNHHKSLDEIVETLKEFTSRCNILTEPLLDLTDFLSTQQSATTATTRYALMTLFIRILIVSPLWIAVSVWPFRIITTRRCLLTAGTLILTFHSRPARVLRALLWRSNIFRGFCSKVTGLDYSLEETPEIHEQGVLEATRSSKATRPFSEQKRRQAPAGVRFTFIVYENQRRWIGLGWTNSLFAYERAPWTDEQLNAVRPRDDFKLPEVEGSSAKWQWVEGSEWKIEDGGNESSKAPIEKGKANSSSTNASGGWIYYDNKVSSLNVQNVTFYLTDTFS
jgi:hypothetical protein